MNRATLLILLAALATAARPARAHEIGKTQATASFFDSGRYQIDIIVDPDALVAKLRGADRTSTAAAMARGPRDAQIASLGPAFLDAIDLRFDGVRAKPRFTYLPASALGDFASAPSVVRLEGLAPPLTDQLTLAYRLAVGTYALNIRIGDAPQRTIWVDGPRASEPVSLLHAPPPAARTTIAWQYLRLGFVHILPNGLDHILFVVGLFLLSATWRPLLTQISAFTIAHSITLGLTMYGIVSLPPRLVEPLIAVSIVYVAIENLLTADLQPWRVALVFSFGLLHGMGFAGVLRDVGLPGRDYLPALVAFNAGVEAGQLTVIAMAFGIVAYWRRNPHDYRRVVVQPASIAISLVGLFWTLQRAIG